MVLICGTLYSQETLSKTIEKSFKLSNAGELHIDNKHGNVSFKGWKENRAKVSIEVKVSHKKKESAQELLDRIQPDIKEAGDFVSITSLISNKNKSTISSYFKKVNPFEFDKSNLDINYTIYLPTNTEIDITNKFGDVLIENWTGKLKANVEHGDLWILENLTNAKIAMKFGKLRANVISYGVVNLKNGEMDLSDSENLLLNTSGSTIELESINDLEIHSSKDEVSIDTLNNLIGQLKYSDMTINALKTKTDLNMSVSEFRINSIMSSDADVKIIQESSNIHINIANASFKFRAYLEEGLLRLPKTFENINSTLIDKGDRIREITATYGLDLSGTFDFKGEKGVIILDD
ncbi:hypothetical protein [Cognatitamlana onchidii]|uniref:hypothetical protein n=1 Tax=Cognatitamlana onchidii TaxID=2562860 RepID=UPI0010A6368C|nr:hypothetical protein [Algibacter onchidii]